jgi:formimidoylglutamase
LLRSPANYPAPRYSDPRDRRIVQIIRSVDRARTQAINILGVPFDGAVLGRKGAAGGPSAIREAMAGFSNYNIELGVGLEKANVIDLGDLDVEPRDVVKAHSQIEAEVAADLEGGSLLVILGGDNSISLPSLRATAKRFGKLGLIVIDSHLDLREEIDGKPTSGSSYGLAVASLREIDSRRVVELGAHGFLNSRTYFEKAKQLGVTLVTADEVHRRGPEAAAKEAYRLASEGSNAVYLSLDLDAFDLSYVSGVSAPSTGGLAASETFRLIYEISKEDKVACADIVELAPSLDPTGKSERVAASALMYLIAGYVSRQRSS